MLLSNSDAVIELVMQLSNGDQLSNSDAVTNSDEVIV